MEGGTNKRIPEIRTLTLSFIQVLNLWYDGAKEYDFDRPGFSLKTGTFTQVIWNDSTELGCASTLCSGEWFVACLYSPGGNVQGRFQENVVPAVRSVQECQA